MLFEYVDIDGDGQLSMHEFMELLGSQLEKVFKSFAAAVSAILPCMPTVSAEMD